VLLWASLLAFFVGCKRVVAETRGVSRCWWRDLPAGGGCLHGDKRAPVSPLCVTGKRPIADE
jgi:hypothetical protein